MKKLQFGLVAMITLFVFSLSVSTPLKAATKENVAISGFCPVCVVNGMKVKGSDHFVTEYKGKVYRFAGFEQQKMFFESPDRYTQDIERKYMKLEAEETSQMREGSHTEEGAY